MKKAIHELSTKVNAIIKKLVVEIFLAVNLNTW